MRWTAGSKASRTKTNIDYGTVSKTDETRKGRAEEAYALIYV